MQHLTKEQCEKLRDVGFPQEGWLSWVNDPIDGWQISNTLSVPDNYEMYACPNLQELIDWLGDDFARLEYYPGENFGNRWVAARARGDELPPLSAISADTPLEAVFNLCLAIKGRD